ncbi:MAG: alpha/beta fold hydrolase [Pyrinomonadaceae bacterium]
MTIHKFYTKTAFLFLSVSFLFACQNQTVSNSSNSINTDVLADNVNAANQTNAEIPAPQNIKFESADKVEIVGTFYESPKANSPAVLMLHQFGSNRKSFDEYAKYLQSKGFGILAIDGRGFGESKQTTDGKTVAPGTSADIVVGMKADVANAFDFLAKQKNIDAARIGIVGASYGSSLALIYAAENKQVKAAALLSPGINYFDNLPTMPAIKNYGDRPLLLVAAEDDAESAEAVGKLKEAGANEKYETQIYEQGGHGTDIFKANVGLDGLLEQFLMKNL